jgi:hypothetical protein
MKWSRVIFSGALTHFMPTPLKARLIGNIVSRGGKISKEWSGKPGWPVKDDLKRVALHLGGSTFVNEPWVEVPMGGVTFSFLARDFRMVLYKIENAKPRHELGQTTYKIHGDLHCIVLLPQQRTALIHRMRARTDDADDVFDAFIQEWKSKRSMSEPEKVTAV